MSEHKKKKNPAATMMMTSLAYIVLGIVTVVFPQKVLDVLCYALGGAMTAGLISRCFRSRRWMSMETSI